MLSGAGITAANDRGIWGGVAEICVSYAGRRHLSVAPGTDLTIQSFPPKITLNDAGQLSVPVRFTDSSYALVLIDCARRTRSSPTSRPWP